MERGSSFRETNNIGMSSGDCIAKNAADHCCRDVKFDRDFALPCCKSSPSKPHRNGRVTSRYVEETSEVAKTRCNSSQSPSTLRKYIEMLSPSYLTGICMSMLGNSPFRAIFTYLMVGAGMHSPPKENPNPIILVTPPRRLRLSPKKKSPNRSLRESIERIKKFPKIPKRQFTTPEKSPTKQQQQSTSIIEDVLSRSYQRFSRQISYGSTCTTGSEEEIPCGGFKFSSPSRTFHPLKDPFAIPEKFEPAHAYEPIDLTQEPVRILFPSLYFPAPKPEKDGNDESKLSSDVINDESAVETGVTTDPESTKVPRIVISDYSAEPEVKQGVTPDPEPTKEPSGVTGYSTEPAVKPGLTPDPKPTDKPSGVTTVPATETGMAPDPESTEEPSGVTTDSSQVPTTETGVLSDSEPTGVTEHITVPSVKPGGTPDTETTEEPSGVTTDSSQVPTTKTRMTSDPEPTGITSDQSPEPAVESGEISDPEPTEASSVIVSEDGLPSSPEKDRSLPESLFESVQFPYYSKGDQDAPAQKVGTKPDPLQQPVQDAINDFSYVYKQYTRVWDHRISKKLQHMERLMARVRKTILHVTESGAIVTTMDIPYEATSSMAQINSIIDKLKRTKQEITTNSKYGYWMYSNLKYKSSQTYRYGMGPSRLDEIHDLKTSTKKFSDLLTEAQRLIDSYRPEKKALEKFLLGKMREGKTI